MIEMITLMNSKLNDFVWGVPAMVLILGVGLWLSCRSRFIQIRKFGTAIRCTIGRIFRKENAQEGAVTPFQGLYGAGRNGGYREYCRCSRCDCAGRPRGCVLDVGQCPAGDVHQVCRSDAGRAFP